MAAILALYTAAQVWDEYNVHTSTCRRRIHVGLRIRGRQGWLSRLRVS